MLIPRGHLYTMIQQIDLPLHIRSKEANVAVLVGAAWRACGSASLNEIANVDDIWVNMKVLSCWI